MPRKKQQYDIIFHGDDGVKKIGSAEATTPKSALRDYCQRSGAGQLSCVCRRLTAKLAEAEEK
jgi:hypothetical protein